MDHRHAGNTEMRATNELVVALIWWTAMTICHDSIYYAPSKKMRDLAHTNNYGRSRDSQ